MAEHQRLDARSTRVIQARRVGSIRDDDRDPGVELPPLDGIDDRPEIGASAGNENTQRAIHRTVAILSAERSDNATNVRVPLVQPPVGKVGAPMTNRFSWSCV